MGSLFGSESSSSSSSESTSTSEHYQQDQYDQLLGSADQWLSDSSSGTNPNFTSQMGAALGAMGNQYMDVLSGKVDRTALQNSLTAQADAMNTQLSRGAMRDVGLSSIGAGTSNSSRRGIAEGVAIGDANAALAQQQANTINSFEQQQIQNQNAAAAGMGNVMGALGDLQANAQANTPEAQRLKALLAYQQMISGNMGGTNTSTGTSNSSSSTSQGIGSTALGVAGVVGGFMSDEDLKKNIKKKKDKKGKKLKTKDGIDIAEWEWNKEAEKEFGLKGKSEGVIAQEAEKKRPDAVGREKRTGYRKVNYGALM